MEIPKFLQYPAVVPKQGELPPNRRTVRGIPFLRSSPKADHLVAGQFEVRRDSSYGILFAPRHQVSAKNLDKSPRWSCPVARDRRDLGLHTAPRQMSILALNESLDA